MKIPSALTVEENVDSAAALEWRARTMATGLNLGKHQSRKLGVGMEFNQFRNYVQGDDVRLLDWKMYAKTGQYFIRQADVETNYRLQITIDNSKSMDYVEEEKSKLDIAKMIAATLTYVMAQQSDQFSWTSQSTSFSKSQGLKNWRRSLLVLNKLQTSDSVSADIENMPSIQSGIHLWITDLYLDVKEFDQFVARNNKAQNELIVFHLIGKDEEQLNFDANSKFIDLESGEEMHVNAKKLSERYRNALGQHMHQIKTTCRRKGIVYRKVYMQADLKNELRAFLLDYNALR